MKNITLYQIKTKIGFIYVEPLVGTREEEDRIKIFDSDTNYIDYIPVETLITSAAEQSITVEEEYSIRLKAFREAETIRDLMNLISQNWISIVTNPFDLEEKLDIKYVDEKRALHEILNNDCVNKVGQYYILMEE
jgi:hypothetical protein